MQHDPLMLVRLFGRLETTQGVAWPTALEGDAARHPGDAVACTRHVPGARRDVARVPDDEFRLGQIPRELERPRQPEAGVDDESREDAPLGLVPDAAVSCDRLANAPVLAQRKAQREGRGQIGLDVEPSGGSFAELSGVEEGLCVALHDRRLVVEPKCLEVRPPRPHVQRGQASGPFREARRRRHGVARKRAPLCGSLLQPEQDRGLLRVLFELEDFVACVGLTAVLEGFARFRNPRQGVRRPRRIQQRRRSSRARVRALRNK